MDIFFKKAIQNAFWVSIVLGVILFVFNRPLTYGLWLGTIVGQINVRLTASYYDNLLFQGEFRVGSYLWMFFINTALMAGSLYVGGRYPALFNVFMVALGLVMVKLVLYVLEWRMYRKRE